MLRLMRCLYCGVLQDEPAGAKLCALCGGDLTFEREAPWDKPSGYVRAQMELDQVRAPSGRNVDRHLLVTIQTPAQVPPQECAPTKTGRSPLSFSAILDVSGSMRGPKITQAKEAVRHALRRLHNGDLFSLITFASDVKCPCEPAVVDKHTRRVVESTLQEIWSGGMTALHGGLELGLKKVLAVQQETNLALLLSDGQANVGETDIEIVGQSAYQARRRGVIVSTLGLGRDYNEALMAEIATQGGGRFYHVMQADKIGPYLSGELGEVATLAARDASLRITLPAGATLIPLSSAYPTQQGSSQATVSIGSIPSDTELEIPLRLTLHAQPANTRQSVEGALTYRSPAGNRLETPLNRVTVRFMEQRAFGRRDGVVVPVVERVLEQIKAVNVLGTSRAMAKSAAEGAQRANASLVTLREYAALLGEERAEEEALGAKTEFSAMQAAPAAAKTVVAAAFALHRSAKKFSKSGQ